MLRTELDDLCDKLGLLVGARRYCQLSGLQLSVALHLLCCTIYSACLVYLHWGPGHAAPSLESIYRVSLTVGLCEGNKIISF